MSFTGTGIIRAEWHQEMMPLFARHGIPMDFERRGFYTFASRWTTRSRIILALLKRPRLPLLLLLGADNPLAAT